MTNTEFCEALRAVLKVKTKYAKGGYGCYSSQENVNFLSRLYPTWYHTKRRKDLLGSGAYLFDCVCFIKSVVNGWNGDISDHFGGSKPGQVLADVGTETIMHEPYANHRGTSFTSLKPGNILHKEGHVGVYIGQSQVIECCWDDSGGGVRISDFDGSWDSHARLACIDYTEADRVEKPVETVEKVPLPCFWDPQSKTVTIDFSQIV